MNSKRTQGSGAEGQNQCKDFELNVLRPGTSPCGSLVLVIGQVPTNVSAVPMRGLRSLSYF